MHHMHRGGHGTLEMGKLAANPGMLVTTIPACPVPYTQFNPKRAELPTNIVPMPGLGIRWGTAIGLVVPRPTCAQSEPSP